MSACTFFGHRDCPLSVKTNLRIILIDLIENHCVDTFYVGCQGSFDAYVMSVLKDISCFYPHIQYAAVLNRIPVTPFSCETVFPEGIENIHPRFRISWRNKWMIDHSDYIVSYVIRSWGGAYQFTELAKKKHKHVYYVK